MLDGIDGLDSYLPAFVGLCLSSFRVQVANARYNNGTT